MNNREYSVNKEDNRTFALVFNMPVDLLPSVLVSVKLRDVHLRN